MSHVCKRIFFKFELQLSSYWQNIKFSRYWPKFHIFTNIVIFQVYLQLFRPTASSLEISRQGHVRNTLFHFCQLPPVNRVFMNTAGRDETRSDPDSASLDKTFKSDFKSFSLKTKNWKAPGGGGALNFFQVGVCGLDFQSVGLANWYLPLKRGACELKISKFGYLWAENFQIWGLES